MLKKIIIFLFISLACKAQEYNNKEPEGYNLYISGGIHAGAWSTFGLEEIPYSIQFDKVFKNKFLLGAGYAYDHYSATIYQAKIPAIRQNIRLRFAWYLKDPEKTFSTYLGFSAGLSNWLIKEQYNLSAASRDFNVPTVQFLFGMKVKLNETLFWSTELGLGAPYLMQTAIGVKF
jgi:hypothetical protein